MRYLRQAISKSTTMIISEVAKLSPLNRFLYWMRERHNIYLKRRAGAPKPWTDDEVLRSFFFTHPYRELDKVTVWFKENIREPLRDRPEVLFATICFRWFNLPETGNILAELPWTEHQGNLLLHWDPEEALSRLREVRDVRKGQVFTGAFMINSPPGRPKLEAIVERINNVWDNREALKMMWEGRGSYSMQDVHKALTQYDGLGGFMAYEIVCDLRYTAMLEEAPDKMTWCNVGPGARRGLYRVLGVPFEKGNNSTSPPPLPNEMDEMRKLLAIAQKRLRGMPSLEMREIEHSLCEADKYCRSLEGDGKLKRTYRGV